MGEEMKNENIVIKLKPVTDSMFSVTFSKTGTIAELKTAICGAWTTEASADLIRLIYKGLFVISLCTTPYSSPFTHRIHPSHSCRSNTEGRQYCWKLWYVFSLHEHCSHRRRLFIFLFSSHYLLLHAGIGNDHVVHLVKSKPASSSSPAGITPSQLTQAARAGDPLVKHFESMGFAGEAAEQQATRMREMMNSPQFQDMFSNPETIRSLLMADPMMRNMLQENPELESALLNNPEELQRVARAMANPVSCWVLFL